jgi:hypothetical protein
MCENMISLACDVADVNHRPQEGTGVR